MSELDPHTLEEVEGQRNEKLNTNHTKEIKPATATIDSRSTQQQPLHIKRSSSVSSMTNMQRSSSLSRSPDDELQQKLNKRLTIIKKPDPDALEKYKSTVQRNMSQNRAIGQMPVS